MRILVTGATGFLGGHLARRLAQTGHQVTCLVRDPGRAAELGALGHSLMAGDITDRAAVARAMAGQHVLLNLAAINEHWLPDNRDYARVNVEGVRTVMEAALAAGVEKVVHVSTALVYGVPAQRPFTEETPPGPVASRYAASKRAGDRIALRWHQERGLPLTVIYPGGIVGPGNTKQTSLYITSVLEGKMPAVFFPDSVSTYVHVADVVELILRAAERPESVGQHYLAGNARLSNGQMNALLHDITGVKLPRLTAPAPLVLASAGLLTAIADRTKRPPLLGMARDSMRILQHGLEFDGTKAERDLGIRYTPIRRAIEEELATHGKG